MMKKASAYMAGIVLAGAAITGVAGARSLPAFDGKAFVGSQNTCLNVNYTNGWLTNNGNCGAASVIVEIPLLADNPGNKSVDMTVSAPDTAATFCRVVTASRTGTNIMASGFAGPAQVKVAIALPLLTGVNLQAKGVLYVDCDLGNGASLIQVDYNS
jgi:hypothetical protein